MVGVIAASIMALTLLTALVVTIRANRIARQQGEIARTQRERAERRFNDVRKLADFMIFDLPGPIHLVRGSVAVEKMLYDNGLKYLDSLAAEAEGDASLQRQLAAGYKRLGDSQGIPFGGGLGDSAGALVSYRKSLPVPSAQGSEYAIFQTKSNFPMRITRSALCFTKRATCKALARASIKPWKSFDQLRWPMMIT